MWIADRERAVLAPRVQGDVTLSVGSIAAIVLGVVVFMESIVLYCMLRNKNGGHGQGTNGRWFRRRY